MLWAPQKQHFLHVQLWEKIVFSEVISFKTCIRISKANLLVKTVIYWGTWHKPWNVQIKYNKFKVGFFSHSCICKHDKDNTFWQFYIVRPSTNGEAREKNINTSLRVVHDLYAECTKQQRSRIQNYYLTLIESAHLSLRDVPSFYQHLFGGFT